MENPASLPSPLSAASATHFVDRRSAENQRKSAGLERRQFTNSFADLSAEAAELGQAVDAYKLQHHRRFINYEELLSVIKSLGYERPQG